MTDPIRVRDMERLVLRISPNLRELLETRAKINDRSMNAEAAAILEQALDAGPAALISRALTQYHLLSRKISNTEERRQHLAAQRDELRSAIVELMPDERAADALIRGYEAERAKEDAEQNARIEQAKNYTSDIPDNLKPRR
ncbi:Arc family DNA-binding protein [Sphingomonas sp. PB2P12]|uniref:Arc family DNA-binding protein n=1 Tax=Sphingomonas sandaracina TaxID=3096157 RepID=UPI002FCBB33B